MAEADLRAEVEALRREIAAMRAERAAGGGGGGGGSGGGEARDHAGSESSATGLNEQLRILAHEISAFAEEAEKGIVNHRLASVVGALILGILIGRMIHR
jgi:hypothetical protein